MAKEKSFTREIVPRCNFTVHVSGTVTHDNGNNYDTYFIEFSNGIEFAVWLHEAIRAMENKEEIEIKHHHYYSYAMKPEKIILGGTVKKGFRKRKLQ